MGEDDEEVASSKDKKRYPIYDQNGGKMAKIDTLFMTKRAENLYPLGPLPLTKAPSPREREWGGRSGTGKVEVDIVL